MMVHLFGGCAGEEIMRGGRGEGGVDSLCYCLMTVFISSYSENVA